MARPDEKIPFFAPDLGDAEKDALAGVIDDGWIAMGPRVERFERRFAELVGTRHAIAVSSGTAALHLVWHALDLGAGDEVVVPSLCFAATANAVHMAGATPVFADICGPDDWTLDPGDVERRFTARTRAVVAMHYGGHPCDMDRLGSLCDAHGLTLVEDACHGLGARLDGVCLGALSKAGCFSFTSNKLVTTGEGGMIATDDGALAERVRWLRSHGMTHTAIERERGAAGYEIREVGFNYRMDDLRAALGLAQLERLPELLARRRALAARYRIRLEPMEGVAIPSHGSRGEPAAYLLAVLLEGADRSAVRKRLDEAGVQTSVHYTPTHLLASHRSGRPVSLPRTEDVALRALSLPLYPSMGERRVDRVCDALEAALADHG